MIYSEWAKAGFYNNVNPSSRFNVNYSRLSGTRGGRTWVRSHWTLMEVRDGRVVVVETFYGGSAQEAAADKLRRLRAAEAVES